MKKEEVVLGIDIGGTNFRVGLVDKKGEITKYMVVNSSILLAEGNNSLEKLVQFIDTYLAENLDGIPQGIAIGFPSTVSKDKKKVYSTPNLQLSGFENVNIPKYIGVRTKVPVFINKDVNFLLTYDLAKMNLDRKGIMLGMYIGTGFGNSIYINGEFLDGKNGVAGELGHIPTLHVTTVCGCGNRGCAEIYASGTALRKLKDEFFTDTFIGDVFLEHSQDQRIMQYINGLSIPIATEINIFDPDYIIIGGGIPSMKGFPKKHFEKCILQHTRKPYPANSLNIVYSENMQEAGVIGAGLYAFQQLGNE